MLSSPTSVWHSDHDVICVNFTSFLLLDVCLCSPVICSMRFMYSEWQSMPWTSRYFWTFIHFTYVFLMCDLFVINVKPRKKQTKKQQKTKKQQQTKQKKHSWWNWNDWLLCLWCISLCEEVKVTLGYDFHEFYHAENYKLFWDMLLISSWKNMIYWDFCDGFSVERYRFVMDFTMRRKMCYVLAFFMDFTV